MCAGFYTYPNINANIIITVVNILICMFKCVYYALLKHSPSYGNKYMFELQTDIYNFAFLIINFAFTIEIYMFTL